MALVTSLIVDLVAETIILTCTVFGTIVEEITFENSNNQMSFKERGEVFVSGIDFMELVEQIKIFEVAILFNFSINNSQTLPYNQVITDNTLDSQASQWNLTISSVEEPWIVEYSAILSSIEVMLHKRGSEKVIEFSEWLVVLKTLKNYQVQVRDYLNL